MKTVNRWLTTFFIALGTTIGTVRAEIEPPSAPHFYPVDDLADLNDMRLSKLIAILDAGGCKGETECSVNEFNLEAIDLNSDGVLEYLYSIDGQCGSGGCTEAIVMKRGGTWQFLGMNFGEITIELKKTNGFRDVRLHNKHYRDEGGFEMLDYFFTWDGKQYRFGDQPSSKNRTSGVHESPIIDLTPTPDEVKEMPTSFFPASPIVRSQVSGLMLTFPQFEGLPTFFWPEAVKRCNSLVAGGYSDWRLPTEGEARKLTKTDMIPFGQYFDDKLDCSYWTSTETVEVLGIKGAINFTGDLRFDSDWQDLFMGCCVCVRKIKEK